jgi:ketosteroid isomerase-like protein
MVFMNDEAAVRKTIAEYAQFADDARLDDIVGLWTVDGSLITGGSTYVGRARIRDYLAGTLTQELNTTKHLALNSVITLDEANAEATSDFVLLSHRKDGTVISAVGRYSDRLERNPDRWRIAERSMVASAWSE